jgi:hypothetical protein
VIAQGKPLAGLRLRLPLNGAVWSQWAVSDEQGRYRIPVPPGEYRIDGFELDYTVANRLLPGLTMSPDCSPADIVTRAITGGAPAEGPAFEFVPVVRKRTRGHDVATGESAVISWEPYPGAARYRVDVMAQRAGQRVGPVEFLTKPGGFEVGDTSLDLAAVGPALKPGYAYSASIDALDANGRTISTTPVARDIPDIRVRN